MTKEMGRVWIGVCVLMLFAHEPLLGQTTTEFGAAELNTWADTLQGFFFGTVLKFVGIFGAIGSIVHGVSVGSFKPILSYGAIGVCCAFMPSFISGVFTVSGMLLP